MPSELFQKAFNTGIVTFIPPGATPSPIQVTTLKDIHLDISVSVKELRGSNLFADDMAPSDGKISGKAKSGRILGSILSACMQGMTTAAGQRASVYDERAPIPTTPFTITVANSTTWVDDLGVIDVNTGLQMQRVASAPATGQYSVAAGVYTFAAADVGHVISFKYSYTIAATGTTLSLVNAPAGMTANKFGLHCFNNYDGAASGWKLYAVMIPKLSLAYKAGDYAELDLDFQACADSAGRVIDFFKA